MNKSRAAVLVTALWAAGCGPAPLTGKVEVVGGSAAGVVVQVAGPVASSVVCDEAGAFKLVDLKDGDYALKAEVAGTEEKTQTLAVTVKDGKASKELTLTFHAPSGTVKGKVVFADGSDAAGLVVNLTGADTRAATTGAGGAFGFEGVPAGGWVVSVEAPWTLEGRVALGVGLGVGQAADVGTLDLSPVGELGGVVSQGATPEALVQLVVAGTTLTAVSDAAGAFSFPRVPAGDRTVLASKGAGLGALAGTAAVKVVRGKNASLAVGMTKVLPKTGTVAGTITFTSAQAPTLITLTVAGAQVTGAPALDGNYALTVPVGTWEVFATAPNYPKQSLGVVVVNEGLTTQLKPAILSWWVLAQQETAPYGVTLGAAACEGGPWASIAAAVGMSVRLAFINTKTLERRQVANGIPSPVLFSSNCKYAYFVLDGLSMVYEVGTANLRPLGFGGTDPVAFSTDESTLFLARNGSALAPPPLGTQVGLERVNLNSFASTGFPSVAGGVSVQTVDRFFVREAGNSVRLVTPTAEPVVFTSAHASFWGVYPTAWALTNCAGTCTLKVLPANGTAANTVLGSYSSAATVSGSTADWLGFAVLPAAVKLVRTSDASATTLPVTTDDLSINPDGTRLAYFATPAAVIELHEEPLPPTGTSPVIASSSASFARNWLSNTRFIAHDGPGNRAIEVKAGAVTIDTALAVPAVTRLFCTDGALAVWAQSGSPQKWKVLLGDLPALSADGPTVSNPGGDVTCSARRPVAGDPAVVWGGFSLDETATYVVDGAAGLVRRQAVGRVDLGGAFLSEGVEVLSPRTAPMGINLFLPATGQLIHVSEPGRGLAAAGLSKNSGVHLLGVSEDALWVGRLWH